MSETKAVEESMFIIVFEHGDAAKRKRRLNPIQISSYSNRTGVGADFEGKIGIRPK